MRKEENYAFMYKEIGLSHETLQTALRFLLRAKLIKRVDRGHKKSYYEITEKGRRYFLLMKELRELS